MDVMPEKGVFDDEKIAELLASLGRESQVGLTMPQVFAPDGTSIGGFDQLRAYFK
ncbi:thioredoxin [Escherichia phage vB_EcoM_005]|uniref:Thioredoxin n=1 Tax=Escherichia phage vB_EcoM_005 TaxID=2500761 RepID=A0A3Q9R9B6_9CAUD|nr:thioredoxin [Escherichia phage vB_EcoM_005]AZV01036.1 thioredoxin [Escherichia phage vB_EcoM_005]